MFDSSEPSKAMTDFILHPRLQADTAFVAEWNLSRVLLMNDARYAWLVLVPRTVAATEIFDLTAAQRALLTEEIARASQLLKTISGAAKRERASYSSAAGKAVDFT